MEGVSGTGKTALALKLAYKKWKDGYLVFCSQFYAFGREEVEKLIRVGYPVVLVLDDIILLQRVLLAVYLHFKNAMEVYLKFD